MRISTNQIFQGGLNDILDAQRRVFDLQNQIGSGKRVETPGDDPVAASQIITVKNQLALTNQYQRTADEAESRLQLEENALRTVKNTLDRIRELAIQAGDGALTKNERRGISVEVGQRLEQLLGVLNTRDFNNQYIFAGYQSGTKPFVSVAGGGFNYQGDEGQLFVQVSESLNIAVSDPGKAIFVDLDEANNFTAIANAANTGTAVIDNQVVIDQPDFDAFYPEGATVTFSVSGGSTNYSVTRVSDGAVLTGGDPPISLLNVPYTPGQPIEFEGIHLNVSGAPADGDTLDLTSDPSSKLDMLGAVQKLQRGLESLGDNPIDTIQRVELVGDTLISIDNALRNVTEAQARIGSRLNAVDDARNTLSERELITREVLSDLEDLDYAEALSALTQQSFILEAIQQSYVRISGLSLFNLI